MRIAGWHVDGFGQLNDLDVHNLPEGLVVVHGPNEAGKSTLVDFLTGMLFGFPAGSTRRLKRPPVRGGNHGGKLWLTSGRDSFLVTRRAKQLEVRRDESACSPIEFAAELGGITRGLYEAVYAVDLDALAGLAALDDDELNDLVFSAGVVGAGRSARGVLEVLGSRRAELYRPRGKVENYRILKLRAELREAEAALRDAQRGAVVVPQQRRAHEAAKAEAAEIRREVDCAVAEEGRLQTLLKLWPTHVEAVEARRRLGELPVLPAVGSELVTRLDAAETAVEQAEAELADQTRALDQTRERAASIVVDQQALAAGPDVEHLCHELALDEHNRGEVGRLATQLAEARRQLAELVAQLGPHVEPEQLSAWTLDVAGIDWVVDAGAELERARSNEEAAKEGIQREVEEHEKAAARLRSRRESIEAEGVWTVESLDRDIAQLDALALHLDRVAAHEQSATSPVILPGIGWLQPGLGVSAVVLALACFGSAVGGQWLAAVLLGLGAAVLAGGALLVRRAGPASAVADREVRSDSLASDRAEARRIADDLGLSGSLTPARVAAALSAARAERDEAAGRASSLAAVARESTEIEASAAVARANAEGRLRRATSTRLAAEERWSHVLVEANLPSQLTTRGAQRFCEVAVAARTQVVVITGLEAAASKVQASVKSFSDAVREAASVAGASSESGSSGDSRVLLDQLRRMVESAARAQAERNEVEGETRHRASALTRTRERADQAARAAGEILVETDLPTAEAVRKAAAVTAERRANDAVVRELERAVGLAAGDAHAPAVLAELSSGDPVAWRSRLTRLAAERAEAEERRDLLVADIADRERQLASAERSSDVAAAALTEAGLRSELAAEVRSWMVMSLARGLVSETLARYQRDRQPQVLARAQELFELVTDGRYPQLRADEGVVTAVDRASNDVAASALSRGTREQLYLCLRFALAESLADRAPLPLLLDDVLVNFDDDRAPRVATVIAEVARNLQVLVFTCTSATRDLLLQADPTATVVPLDRTTGSLVPIAGSPRDREEDSA